MKRVNSYLLVQPRCEGLPSDLTVPVLYQCIKVSDEWVLVSLTEDGAADGDDDVLDDEEGSGGAESRRPVDPGTDDGSEDDDDAARREAVNGHQPG